MKFLRTPLNAVAIEAVQQQLDASPNRERKAGYLECYEDLVVLLKDKSIGTLVELQDVMGTLARKGKAL